MLLKLANKLAGSMGFCITRKDQPDPDSEDIRRDVAFQHLYQMVQPCTMTSMERLFALYEAVNFTIQKQLPGAFVECGVWKGGSSMMIALTLKKLNILDRDLYLYDTFEGMSEPSEADKDLQGNAAKQLLETSSKDAGVWAYSTLDEVKENMARTGYPMERIHFVKGKVEDTIPGIIPEQIALLRLDTDWYESTRHELVHLYPRLAKTGALIIDDFGHWQGAKKAVLEYFDDQPVLMNRIDYTGRLIQKL